MILLALSVAFALASVLFSNMSWAVAGVSIASTLVYSRLRFASDIKNTQIEMKRAVLDEMAFSQEPVSVRLELINKSSTAVKGSFEDVLPEDCTLSAGDNKTTLLLPSRSMLVLNYSVIPKKRGPHTIPGVRIEREDPFGVFEAEQFLERPTTVNAHTRRESIERARKLAGKEHFEFSGVTRNPAVVLRELEFDGIREYLPGDRARDIHWKLLPKINKLMTKIYRKEGSVQTMIFVDCGRSMRMQAGPVPKLDHAIELAMQISNVLISSFHPAGVATFDELRILMHVNPSLGRHQFERIIQALSTVPETIDSRSQPGEQGVSSVPSPRKETNNDSSSKEFLSRLETLPGVSSRPGLGLGLEGAVKRIVAHSKGQEQLFIVISDLASSREAILSAATTCQKTGHRMLVIHSHHDWYIQGDETADIEEMEGLYANLSDSVKLEAGLRSLGASYIRIGPADTASGIVRAVRRGKA